MKTYNIAQKKQTLKSVKNNCRVKNNSVSQMSVFLYLFGKEKKDYYG